MLINTVILFLRDSLPIFLLLVLLLIINNQLALGRQWLYGGIVCGIATSILLVSQVDVVASAIEGTGLEWFYSLGYVFIYLGILLALYARYTDHKRLWSVLTLLLLLVVLTLNSSNFLVYITGYWPQADTLKPQLIGIVLGLGILLSISILLYFALEFSDRQVYAFTSSWLTLLFGAGQLLQASKLLLQIDMLPGLSPLWDSNHLLEESSGMGHFLTALFGYDASPSLIQVIIYLSAVIAPSSYLLLAQANKRKVNQKEELL